MASKYPTVRPSLTLDFRKSKQLDPRILFSRSSSATYVEGGVVKYAEEHQARFEDEGLLIEESRTNAVLYSEDFQNQWSVGGGGSGGSATNSQTVSPDGNNTGAKFAAPATRYLVETTTETGMPNTGVRFNLATGTFDSIITGSPDSYDIDPAGNGWYRCWFTVSNLTCSVYAKKGELDFIGIQILNSNVFIYALNSTYNQTSTTDGIYVWGAQLETGYFPTSYIPTSGSTVTRAADIAQITGDNFSSWYNTFEGTIILRTPKLLPSTGNKYYYAIGPSGSERIATYQPNDSSFRALIQSSGATFSGAINNLDEPIKSALSFNGSGASWAVNGSIVDTSTTITPPATAAELSFSTRSTGAVVQDPKTKFHLTGFTYYSERLTDEQLEAITL